MLYLLLRIRTIGVRLMLRIGEACGDIEDVGRLKDCLPGSRILAELLFVINIILKLSCHG